VVSPNVPYEPLAAAGITRVESAEEAIRECAAHYPNPHIIVMPDAPYTVGMTA
jgi:hypothetical protein